MLLVIVALPLGGAALSTLFRSRTLDRILLLAIPATVMGTGIYLLGYHTEVPVIAHSVGGYVDGLAIPFVSDTLAALLLTVTSFAALVCCWFLVLTGEDQYRFVPALILMMLTGVYGAVLTGDMFNLFVFVEVMVLPSYALIAVTGTWRRLGVGRMFVMVNLLTSTILLVGVGFVYGTLGSVNIAVIAQLDEINPPAQLAIGIVLMAFFVKAGAVPVHGWLVRSYPFTSGGMMALFSALHTKVGLYGVYRVYTAVFGQPPAWAWVLAAIAVITILLAVISAFGEGRIRNVLVFQMTSGVGHIVIGVALLTAAALSAGLFYLVHHIITMAGLLLIMGAVEQTYGTGSFKKLSGLAGREKWAATLMVLGLFSLVGLPTTSGVWGKVSLVRASAAAESTTGTILIVTIVVGSLISMLALQRMWSNTFWGAPMTHYHPDSLSTGRAPQAQLTDEVRIKPALLMPATVMIGTSVALFFAPELLLQITDRTANSLLDTVPYIEAVLTR
nr:proton-conducting transporter membrane subunit [Brevibacterium daeguense]